MAGVAERTLALKLIANTAPAEKQLRGVTAGLKKAGAAAKSWGKAFVGAAVITGVQKFGAELDNAFQGFKDGEKAAAQLGNTWQNLGKDAGSLAGVIEQIGDRALELGTDDTEAIQAFNRALLDTGDASKAMRRLGIAQDLVAAGAAPNLASALKLITGAAKGSSKIVDQFGLTATTAKGRIRQLAAAVNGAAEKAAKLDPLAVAMNAIGESLETISGSISTGDLEGLAGGIRDLGAAAGTAAGQTGVLSGIVGQFSGSVLAGLTLGLIALAGTITAALLPALVALVAALAPVWITLGVAVAAVALAVAGLLILQGVLQNVQAAAQSFGNMVSDAFDTAFGALPGLISTAIAEMEGLFGPITEHFNNFIANWNRIADLVPTLPHLPVFEEPVRLRGKTGPSEFAEGGIVTRPTLALIGEKGPEAVIPLSGMGGMGGSIVINISSGVGDPVEIGRQVDRVLRAYRGRAGLPA